MRGEARATELGERFDRDGYLIFDPGIPEGTIDGAVEDLERQFATASAGRRSVAEKLRLRVRRLLRGPRPAVSHRDEVRVQDAWAVSKNVRAIARAPEVLELLRGMYGREPLPFQTINFRVGSQQRAHADTMHFNSEPPGFMCGVWVALEDIDESCGPLIYYPGSHTLPEVSMGDIGAPMGAAGYPAYEEYVQTQIEREQLEPSLAILRKGEALLWASNLLHGGAPQADPARTRLSQVTHYFFEGCRYWTPMASDSRHRAYREIPTSLLGPG